MEKNNYWRFEGYLWGGESPQERQPWWVKKEKWWCYEEEEDPWYKQCPWVIPLWGEKEG